MRDRLPLIVVSLAVLVGLLGVTLWRGAKRGSFADRLSTYRSEPDGARGVFLLLQQKWPATRWQHEFSELRELGKDPLVLVNVRFENDEPFIQRDGGVGWSDEDDQEFRERGLNSLRSPHVSKDETEALLSHVREGGTLFYLPWRAAQTEVLKALHVELRPPLDEKESRTLVPAQPTAFTVGVERVETEISGVLELPAGAVPVLVDHETESVVAALVGYGQGRVLVVAAPQLAMNSALLRADNAQFWRSAVRGLGAKAVHFDEFHHGFTGERSIGEFASRSGLQFAVLQLLFGVALWALSLQRFGRPHEPETALRVGGADTLQATSRLYREGRHFTHAAATLLKQLTAECAERAGVAGGSAPADVANALTRRGRLELATALTATAEAAQAVHSDVTLERVATLAASTRALLHARPSAQTPSSSPEGKRPT